MPVNVNEIIRKLSPAERKKVEGRAAEIIAEEMSLRDLRKARKLTQTRVAKTLGITQDSVSRLEKRSDLLLSTLRKTVKAMGGDVRIVAQFPDRSPVVLSHLAQERPTRKSSRRVGRGRRKASKLTRAQRLVRKHVKPGMSLVDELIAERRKAARNE
jgi:transcriptional regulator with XRE-family HTH domain